MALTDYAGLLAALATFSVRADQTALWPDCVALAEAEMGRSLRVPPMQARAEAVLDGEYMTLPDDFVGVAVFELLAPTRRLKATSAANIARMKPREAAWRADLADTDGRSPPAWYARVGEGVRVFPPPRPGEAWPCELTYWRRLPALSPGASSNWLLERHADAYLYGALTQFGIMVEDERLPAWRARFLEALDGVRAAYPEETDKAALRVEPPLGAG